MSVAQMVGSHLPYLRRYARALTGSQSSGDAFVRATLEAAILDKALHAQISLGRQHLYAVFNRIWSGAHEEAVPPTSFESAHELTAQARLSKMTPLARQALLLTTLEDFSPDDAAIVMGIDASEVSALAQSATDEIAAESATDVLIIEDEPLISMQLEVLVEDLGHTIFGTASTRTQALALVAERRPGLVLADIQLADGSSGIDAVNDILKQFTVPVIFITAFPEKLLTGDRPEPTYLVTKPFQDATVQAAISQAMFFASSQPI
jgi:CheY-like chemotaxis protein/DNA-directed RNA polymerase specialized sigma24 family protein